MQHICQVQHWNKRKFRVRIQQGGIYSKRFVQLNKQLVPAKRYVVMDAIRNLRSSVIRLWKHEISVFSKRIQKNFDHLMAKNF